MVPSQILIEGYTKDELIAFDDLGALVLTGEPMVFRVGSAEVLGQFSTDQGVLKAQLAVVEGGGDGVLVALIDAIEIWSKSNDVTAIEWVVHAADCAEPNPKLLRVLERLGFTIRRLETGTECFWRRVSTNDSLLRRH